MVMPFQLIGDFSEERYFLARPLIKREVSVNPINNLLIPKNYATFFTPGRRLPGRRESASGRGVLRYAFVGPESRLSRGWRLTANRPMRPDPE